MVFVFGTCLLSPSITPGKKHLNMIGGHGLFVVLLGISQGMFKTLASEFLFIPCMQVSCRPAMSLQHHCLIRNEEGLLSGMVLAVLLLVSIFVPVANILPNVKRYENEQPVFFINSKWLRNAPFHSKDDTYDTYDTYV